MEAAGPEQIDQQAEPEGMTVEEKQPLQGSSSEVRLHPHMANRVAASCRVM